MTNETNNPSVAAVTAVQEATGQKTTNDIVVLSSGIRARIKAVAPSLISAATSKIKDPAVPKWFNEEKNREEDNPNHPEYKRALADAEQKRGEAAMDVMYIMGIELLDPIPADAFDRIKFMQARGLIDLGDLDIRDPMVLDFMFKKYVAVSSDDLVKVARKSGISSDDITRAEGMF